MPCLTRQLLLNTKFNYMQRYRTHKTKEPTGFVYIMSNYTRSTLYIGVTSHLLQRVQEHQSGKSEHSFSDKYNCVYLVYYEFYDFVSEAIKREKQLKNWKRAWKNELIAKLNPSLRDLYPDLRDGKLAIDEEYY